MTKKRILISDNSKDFVQLVVNFFSMQPDIEIVSVAYDGNQTMKMIEQTKPDVLLLDLIMPEMDGLEVIKKIYDNGVKLQTIVISAVGNEKIDEIVKEYGIKHYFIKPIKFEEVLNTIFEKKGNDSCLKTGRENA
jgi:two-component system, response regulator, stage 0 sporulation protein A